VVFATSAAALATAQAAAFAALVTPAFVVLVWRSGHDSAHGACYFESETALGAAANVAVAATVAVRAPRAATLGAPGAEVFAKAVASAMALRPEEEVGEEEEDANPPMGLNSSWLPERLTVSA